MTIPLSVSSEGQLLDALDLAFRTSASPGLMPDIERQPGTAGWLWGELKKNEGYQSVKTQGEGTPGVTHPPSPPSAPWGGQGGNIF